MAQLIVVAFSGDISRAGEVLQTLRAMNDDWVVELEDAVAIYRDHAGKLRVDESNKITSGKEAAIGAFWGAFFGSLIAVPLTAGASGAVLAGTLAATILGGSALGATGGVLDATLWRKKFGIPEKFVKTAAGILQPRDSAILALLYAIDTERIDKEFRGYGGTVLQTTLTEEQAAKVQAVLDGKDGWPDIPLGRADAPKAFGD
jgi:uncharacterized membrane protein